MTTAVRSTRPSSSSTSSNSTRGDGRAALPRPPDLPVDLSPRRDRLRGDDRPRPRAARSGSRAAWSVDTPAVAKQERRPTARRSSCSSSPTATSSNPSSSPTRPSQTFCLSTQVGCAMRCAFCLTGKMGIVRNLTAGEIVGQVRVLAARARHARPALQHRADGHGRAAAQLRRDDEGAADSRQTSTAWRCRRGGSRSRPSACCRRSSGWRPSRSCRTWRSRCTPRPRISATGWCRSTGSTG